MQTRRLGLLIFSVLTFGYAHFSQAQEVIDVTRHETIESDDPTAAQNQLMDQAVEEISNENIKGLIGDEKAERSKDIIKNKIIKNSNRYVLSASPQKVVREKNGYAMDVQMRISLKALRAMLLENGLLYQLEGPPKVLPVVQYIDRVSARSYGWWYNSTSKDHADLSDDAEIFNGALKEQLSKIGFYTMSPSGSHFAQGVPEPYKLENLQRADALFLGEFFKSSIIVRGQTLMRLKPGTESTFQIEIHLEALHSGNGRLMAEVVRTFDTEPGAFHKVVTEKFASVAPKVSEDLAAQLSEAWKKGTFGASVVKVTVTGHVTPKELEDFKSTVVLQVHEVKAFRERIIEAHRVTFEADSSALPQQLAQSFRTAKFARFKVEVTDVSPEGVSLNLEAI